MATDAGELIVKISADVSSIKDSLKTTSGAVEGLGALTVAKGNIMADAFIKAAGAAYDFAKSSIIAFGEQEQAITRLSLAVGKDAAQALVEYAKQLQNTTTFSDDSIISLENQLVNYGILPGSIRKATEAVLDFSAATGKDLPEAGAVLGQAMAGQSRELRKFGLELSTVSTRSENLDKTTAFLTSRFHGAADAIRGTVVGQIEGLSHRLDDLKKRIGEELVPVISAWVEWMEKAVKIVEKLTGAEKNKLSVDEITLQNLRERLKLGQGDQQLLVKLIKATQDRIIADQRSATEAVKHVKVRKGAIESEIDAIKSLNEEIEKQQQIEQHLTQITDLEVKKRILMIKNSFELNASFSDQLSLKLAADMANYKADTVGILMSVTNSFADSTAKMIVEGGRFSDVMKNIWRQLAEEVISQIIRMIAEWAILQAMTGGSAGGFGAIFGGFAEGGMVNEPSVITGMRSGRSHFVAENGPEMIVPQGAGSGGGSFNQPFDKAPSGGGGGGDSVTINISGQFIEGNPAKWQRMIQEQIIPELRRFSMKQPIGVVTRKRGAMS